MKRSAKTPILIRRYVLEELANFSPRALTEEQLHDLVSIPMPGGDLDRSDLRHAINALVIADHADRDHDDELDLYVWRITPLGAQHHKQSKGHSPG